MNDFESVTIGDYYTPQPKQQEFHESPARAVAKLTPAISGHHQG